MAMKKLRMMVKGAERTELAPELFEQMGKIDTMYKTVRLFIERIRRAAQPNKGHRTADRLVASEDSVNERLQLGAAFKEAIGTFSENPATSAYLKATAEAQDEVNRFHDRFLRQVQIYCVNELKKFTDQTYVEIKQAYDELEQRRTGYDYARDRLRYCSSDEIEQRGAEAAAQQKLFEDQAAALHTMLGKIPVYQMDIAKAIDNFVKAEREYAKEIHALYRRVLSPESTKPKAGVRPVVAATPEVSMTMAVGNAGPTMRAPPPASGPSKTPPAAPDVRVTVKAVPPAKTPTGSPDTTGKAAPPAKIPAASPDTTTKPPPPAKSPTAAPDTPAKPPSLKKTK